MQVGPAPPAPLPNEEPSGSFSWWQDVAVDRENRDKIKAGLLNDPAPYTKEEEKMIADSLLVIDKLGDRNYKYPEVKLTKHKTRTPLQEAFICVDKKLGITYGKHFG